MPLRDYKCTTCGNVTEHLVKNDESDAPTTCENEIPFEGYAGAPPTFECGGDLERVREIGRTGFDLKGNGWFGTGGY